jgi:hypothetical protein
LFCIRYRTLWGVLPWERARAATGTGIAELTLPEGTGVIWIQLLCASCEWLPEDTASTFAATWTPRPQLDKAAIPGAAVPARQKELLARTEVTRFTGSAGTSSPREMQTRTLFVAARRVFAVLNLGFWDRTVSLVLVMLFFLGLLLLLRH